MKRAEGDKLGELLDRVVAGELDALRPEEVAALDEHLNADPQAGALLAEVLPPVEPLLRVGGAPTPAEWERVWDGIESADGAGAAPAVRGSHRTLRLMRLWQPLLAAAACLVLMFTLTGRFTASAPRPIRLSGDVVVNDLEVDDDADALVMYDDDGSGRAIIWVFEDENQGA